IEQVDDAGQRRPDVSPSGAHGLGCLDDAFAGEPGHIASTGCVVPGRAQGRSQRPSTGHDVQATAVAAGAAVVPPGDVGVPDLAGQTRGTAHDRTVDDETTTDDGADLHAHEHVGIGPEGPLLTEGEQVHVLVDVGGDAEGGREATGDRVVQPGRVGFGSGRRRGGQFDLAGQTDADAVHRRGVDADLVAGADQLVMYRGDDAVRWRHDAQIEYPAPPDLGVEVRHRHASAGHTDLD